MSSLTPQTVRRIIITAAITAITVTGSIYGAGLKTRQEVKQERAAILEAPISERIEQLESLKFRRVQQRDELQSKIDRIATKTAAATSEQQVEAQR